MKMKGKRLAAMIAALTMAVSLAGCGNEITYKMPGGVVPDSQVDDSSSADNSSEKPDDSSSEDPGDSSGVDIPPIDEHPVAGGQTVTETDDEYFSKAAFIGEALCSGIGFYVSDIDDKYVYTENNAHIGDILDTTWSVDGVKYSLADALYASERKYIYIWIGPNDLNNYTPQGFAEKYKEVINSLYYANPMAYVGVVSVAPVSISYEQSLTGGTVDDYNMALSEMVDNIGNNRVYFFNVTSVLGDVSGHLLSEYDSGDGLHMLGTAYKAVAQHLFDNQIHPFVSDFEKPDDDSSDDAESSDEAGEGSDEDGETADGGDDARAPEENTEE